MADLLDIAPSTSCEVVKLDGTRIVVRGLHGDAIASIVGRFPDLAMLLGGGAGDIGPRLIKQFGAAIGPIIAAGCGHLGQILGTVAIERFGGHQAASPDVRTRSEPVWADAATRAIQRRP